MKWRKLGHIFDPSTVNDGHNRPWMKEFAQSTSAITFDDFVRIYFSCRPHKDNDGQATSYTAFVDLDRNDLTKVVNIAKKPILPLGGLGCFDEFAVYPTSVIRRAPNEYVLYYAGWTRMKSVSFDTAIGMATSEDGETFKRVHAGPILSQSPNEPFVISGPKVRCFNEDWYMFYLAGRNWIMYEGDPEVIYKLRLAQYISGEHGWMKHDINIVPDILGENECQAGPDVFFYKGEYHMYFAYRHGLNFRNNDRGYRIGYARSNNLLDWARDDKNAGIGLSKNGWDSTMQHYPHVFQLDGNHYMTYNGNDFGKHGFGLAILEKE